MRFEILALAALLCFATTARADYTEEESEAPPPAPELSETDYESSHPLWNAVVDPESHLGAENYEEPEAALRQGNTMSEVNEVED